MRVPPPFSRWGIALFVILGLSVSMAARADDAGTESEVYVQRGVELRRLGRNQEALEAFQQAYALHPTVRAAAQIALARQALGEWPAAERGIEEALATDDPWVARYHESLERALAIVRTHLGSLYIESNVTQAELFINGVAAGRMPPPGEPIRVAAGTVQFEVRAPDRFPVIRTLEVAAGAQVHVLIALDAPVSPPAPQAPSVTTSGASSGPPMRTMPDSAYEPSKQTSNADGRRKTWGVVALATAGAFSAGGIVAWRVREDNLATWDNDSLCLMGALTRGERCATQGRTASLALGLEIGAFAAATASAVLGAWLLWGPRARPPRAAFAFCTPWAALGVSCGGVF